MYFFFTLIMTDDLFFVLRFTFCWHCSDHTDQWFHAALFLLLTHTYSVPLGHPISAHELCVQFDSFVVERCIIKWQWKILNQERLAQQSLLYVFGNFHPCRKIHKYTNRCRCFHHCILHSVHNYTSWNSLSHSSLVHTSKSHRLYMIRVQRDNHTYENYSNH